MQKSYNFVVYFFALFANPCFFVVGILVFCFSTIHAQENLIKDPEPPIVPDAYQDSLEFDMQQYRLPWVVSDQNRDSLTDAATLINSDRFVKKKEVLDLNYDGQGDDFAFYSQKGHLVYQMIDSNYDQKIDLWITILEGKYIKQYERDLDHDGLVDVRRIYKP